MIYAVHKCLDAFELRVLARPTPIDELTYINIELSNMRFDIDTMLEMRGAEPKSAPTKLEEDSVLDFLFNANAEPQHEQRVCIKRNKYIHTNEASDEARAKNIVRKKMERARRASVVDKEQLQRRALEMVVGASNLVPEIGERITSDGVEVYVGISESGPVDNLLGFRKQDPPTC